MNWYSFKVMQVNYPELGYNNFNVALGYALHIDNDGN